MDNDLENIYEYEEDTQGIVIGDRTPATQEPLEYDVLIRTNELNYVWEVGSTAFIKNTDGYINIDAGAGDKYVHAQSIYFEKPLYDENGIFNYKYIDNKIYEVLDAEKETMISQIEKPLSELELLKKQNILLEAQIQAIANRNEFIEDCVAEMALSVYSNAES